MYKQYQITKHPIGTIREVWAMSWPLMISLVSNSFMMFIDRLFLSWHAPSSLAAGANASMAYFLFLVVPMAICAISEILVGRLHGEGRLSEIGRPVWQTIWFAFLLTLPLWVVSVNCTDLIFYETGNQNEEIAYFTILMYFAPLMCASIAIGGFFIGVGDVKIVTLCAVAANITNAIVSYLFIFGLGEIPSMGISGAAFATGFSQLLQFILLLGCFLTNKNRTVYGTAKCGFEKNYFFEAIRIGGPAGSGHLVEIFAHFIFFRIIMMAGMEQMAIAAMVQSFYLLFGFLVEAISKGVGAIIANLIGGRAFGLISRVFRSAVMMHTFFAFLLAFMMFFFMDSLVGMFFVGEGAYLLNDPQYKQMALEALLWMCVFFLFDGYCWILIGHLTASGDTRFIFLVSSIVNWFAYVLPVYILVGIGGRGADAAWMIIAIYSMVNFGFYYWRYRSGRWLKYSMELDQVETECG